MCCAEPTGPASWPFTSTARATARARSRRCSPPPMPPRRSHRVPRSVISSAPSSCGIRSANAPRRSIAATACGRPPTSPPPRSATNEPCSWRAPRSSCGPPPLGAAWGHERLGRYLWATGRLEESRVEFAQAAAMLGDDEGAAAAPVFAGLGQAELMAGNYATAEQWCAKVFDLVPYPSDNPAAWAWPAACWASSAATRATRPQRSSSAGASVAAAAERARSRPGDAVPVCRTGRRRRLPGRAQHRPRRRRGGTAHRPRPRLRVLLRLARRGSAHSPRPVDRGRRRARPPSRLPTRSRSVCCGSHERRRCSRPDAARPTGARPARDRRTSCRRRLAPIRSRCHDGRCPPRARQLGRGGAAPPNRVGLRRHDLGVVGGAVRDVRGGCRGGTDARPASRREPVDRRRDDRPLQQRLDACSLVRRRCAGRPAARHVRHTSPTQPPA